MPFYTTFESFTNIIFGSQKFNKYKHIILIASENPITTEYGS